MKLAVPVLRLVNGGFMYEISCAITETCQWWIDVRN